MYLFKKQDGKIGVEGDEDQALEETQYAIFFSSPKEPGQCQGLCTTFVLSKHKIKKQKNQDEVRNFSTKKTLSPG